MDRTQLVHALASMTDREYEEVTAEARGGDTADVKAVILRELARHNGSD